MQRWEPLGEVLFGSAVGSVWVMIMQVVHGEKRTIYDTYACFRILCVKEYYNNILSVLVCVVSLPM